MEPSENALGGVLGADLGAVHGLGELVGLVLAGKPVATGKRLFGISGKGPVGLALAGTPVNTGKGRVGLALAGKPEGKSRLQEGLVA